MATALLDRVVEPQEHTPVPARRWENWVAALTWAVLAIGVGWRIGRYLAQFPIWGDEAHIAVNFLDRDLWGMTRKLDYGQVAPVLFLWIEWLAYRFLGPSELSLRLFPLLAGIAGLLLFWRFCRLTLPPVVAALAVGLLAVSYFPVRHATEIKPYSFDLFMTMALLLPAVQWAREPGKIGWLMVLTLVTPVALASSYPVIFVAGAISLFLLPLAWRSTSWQVRGWFVAFNLVMVGTFLAHMFLVGREQLDAQAGIVNSQLQEYWKDWFPPANVLEVPFWLLKAHTGNMFAYPEGGPRFGSTATFLLCLAGLWTVYAARRRDLLTLCLVPFGLSLLAAFLHRYPYGGTARLAQHLAPAICILMAFGIARLLSPWGTIATCPEDTGTLQSCPTKTRRAAVVLAGLCVFGLVGLAATIWKPYKTLGDVNIRQMAEELKAKIEPGDVIVVFNPYEMLRPSMMWYLRLLQLPIEWEGKADWPAVDQHRRLWSVHVRVQEGKKRIPRRMLARSQEHWSIAEHEEYVFPADSKDVPLQYCEIYRWERMTR